MPVHFEPNSSFFTIFINYQILILLTIILFIILVFIYTIGLFDLLLLLLTKLLILFEIIFQLFNTTLILFDELLNLFIFRNSLIIPFNRDLTIFHEIDVIEILQIIKSMSHHHYSFTFQFLKHCFLHYIFSYMKI